METHHGSSARTSTSSSGDLRTPSSTGAITSSKGIRSPNLRLGSFPNEADIDVDALPLSLRSDGAPKTLTIAVALKAHKKLESKVIAYAIQHLVEPRNSRLVVICCLSQVQDPMGVNHPIDVFQFTGINNKVLQQAVATQDTNLNHFLSKEGFRRDLEQQGVPIDVRIATGPNRNDILVLAAKALQPHWVVLDKSFSGQKKALRQRLECNLVLMTGDSKHVEVLKLQQQLLGPMAPDTPVAKPISSNEYIVTSPRPSTTPPSSSSRPSSRPSTQQQQIVSSTTTTTTTSTSTSSSSRHSFSCFTCLCFGPKAPPPAPDGPSKDVTVLFGGSAAPVMESEAAYLGKMNRPKDGSFDHDAPTNLSKRFGHDSASKRVDWKNVRKIEAQLKMSTTTPPHQLEDDYFQVTM